MKNSARLFTLFCCILMSTSVFSQWQQVTTIEGGNVNDLEWIDNTVWAATNAGIFKSTDEGQTWVRDESFPASWYALDIAPIGDEIFVMINEYTPFVQGADEQVYIYRSTDDGVSWEKILTIQKYTTQVQAFEIFRVQGALFVLYDDDLIRSEDGGVTWEDISYSEGGETLYSLGLGHNADEIVISAYSGIYLSQDLGQTWDFIWPAGTNVAPIVGDDVIIAFDNQGLVTSYDLGQSWQNFPLPCALGSMYKGESGKLYAKGNIYCTSEDNGATWDTVSLEKNVYPHDLLELSSGEVLLASDDGFFITSDEGTSLSQANSGFVAAHITDVFVSPSGEIFANTYLGQLRSSDGGQSWQPWELPEDEYPWDVQWISGDRAFVLAGFNIYLTTNGMQEYAKITPNGVFAPEQLEISGDVLYLHETIGDVIWKSHDFGTTWETVDLPFTGLMTNFEVVDQTIIAIEYYHRIWQSTDGGEAWINPYDDEFTLGLDPEIHNSNGRILVATIDQWFYSETNGESWQNLYPQGLPDRPDILSFISVDDVLFAAVRAYGVYVSFDHGSYWQPYNEGLGTLRSWNLSYANGVLVLGTINGSVWLRDVQSTVSVSAHEAIQQLLIYPMPVQHSMTITLPESIDGIANLELHDLNGQSVYSAIIEVVKGTLPTVSVDLPVGFYFSTVICDGVKFGGKVVVK